MGETQNPDSDPGAVPHETPAYIGIVTGLSRSDNSGAAPAPPLAPDLRAAAALKAAARVFGFDPDQYRTRPRGRHPAGRARQCAVAVFMDVTGAGPSQAALAFGIDESTARTARDKDAQRVDALTGSAREAVRRALELTAGEGSA